MHKLILLSSSYQQSSDNNARFAQIDPFNHLLASRGKLRGQADT